VDVEESPSRVHEWLLSSCLQCVVERCHAEESLHAIDPSVFAGLLPPDGEGVDKRSAVTVRFLSNSSEWTIPSISHQMLPRAWSVTYVKIALLEV
jgi:hypothetical protein